MGIQINGQTDNISATDGSLTISGADLPTVTNLNATGIVTATGFVGNITGNINATGISTFTTGPVLIGSGTSTGTASQPLQVTGGAYVSGSLGIGIANPTANFHSVYPLTVAPSLTWGSTAAQILRNENSELAFGLNNTIPYHYWMQARTHASLARELVINPLGGNVAIGTSKALSGFEVWTGTASTSFSVDTSGRVLTPYQPALLMYAQTSNQTVSNNSSTKIQIFNTSSFSRGLTWDTTNHRVTVPVSGYYQVHAKINNTPDGASGNDDFLAVYKNGVNMIKDNAFRQPRPVAQWYQTYFVSVIVSCNANDYLEIWYYQNSGGNRAVHGDMGYVYVYLIG